MNATHQDRVNDLIDELWDTMEEHESGEYVTGKMLADLAERVVGAEDRELDRVLAFLAGRNLGDIDTLLKAGAHRR